MTSQLTATPRHIIGQDFVPQFPNSKQLHLQLFEFKGDVKMKLTCNVLDQNHF